MSESAPVVYLLHGEDDYGIKKFIQAMQEKMGDPTTVEMNTTRMEGDVLDLEALRAASSAMPFLATRRLVVVGNASKKLKSDAKKEKFKDILNDLPPSTALVLIESKTLTVKNWLLKYVKAAGDRAFEKSYGVPKGPQMIEWLRGYAAKEGGEIKPQAASFIAEQVGNDPRMASMEIQKALAYVNYSRPIEIDDVETVLAFGGGQGDFFKLIDAIAAKNGRLAMQMLQRLLDEQAGLLLFFSLVGHFRLLLQTREIFEGGGVEAKVAQELGIHPYRAKKLFAQSKNLSLQALEKIYRRLQTFDLQIKTGKIKPELALETLIATLVG